MRLAKLEMHGFKSFADPTEMLFDAGVTAIVGPNGCGKSNVSDAVRWVLGEQRAKTLRGAKMEEVIFQGSSARRAVNWTEVSLHFENEDGSLGIPYREVVITRRLARSGESEYLLNRTPCRLRDIHDLMRGTGLGADAGVVIEARMVDALLSDRPDERRELFEEAAGVGLYRDRRRSTERRLEETTVDLGRLDDLIAEVQSQVRSLARQRRRAERHAELSGRRFIVEIALASREMATWHGELTTLEARVAELTAAQPVLEAEAATAERVRDAAHRTRASTEAQRAEMARLVGGLRERLLQLQGEIAVAEERQRNAMSRRQRAEDARDEGEQLGVQLERQRQDAAAERAALDEELHAVQTALAARAAAEDDARTVVARARELVDTTEQRAREAREAVHRLELLLESTQHEHAELNQRILALETEREHLAGSTSAAMRAHDAVEEAIEVARTRALDAEAARDEAFLAAQSARTRDAASRAALVLADDTLTALRGKLSALDALERERVGLAPAAAHLLREREQFGDGAIIGPLSDFIAADADSALSVEHYLGATLHAVLVRDTGVIDAIRHWHAQAQPGPLLLLPLDAVDEAQDALPDSLCRTVQAAQPADRWVTSLLGRVRSLSDGVSFIDSRGAVWLPGVITGQGPLQRRAELFALRTSLTARETERQHAVIEADTVRAAVARADAAASAAADAALAAARVLRDAQERRTETERRLQRATREAAEATALAERHAARRATLEERATQTHADIARVTRSIEELDGVMAAVRADLAEAERAHDAEREQHTACHVDEAQVIARLQVAGDRERRLTEEVAVAAARLLSVRTELSELSDADLALAEQTAQWQQELSSRHATLADAETRLGEAELAVHAASDELTQVERVLDDTRRRASALAEESHLGQLRLSELAGRRSAIKERLETEWRRPLVEMLAAAEPVDADDDALRLEADDLRTQIEALGPVNPMAIEEHAEELKRADFLASQRADLAAAKQSLHQAIREIDTTARELFMATFTQVRENFRQIFMTLFGGGECDLRLENPDAPLDCDIEIHASPRGKRTQRIHLLSSGERALVALSLLFGIFLTKPSPFCLLDEVDAPLDDQNIGRFVRMLNQFKTRTQFIVITHNPRTTTEAADTVYGVTMQEPGVSMLVSARMRAERAEAV